MVADWADKNTNDGYRFTAPVGSYPAGVSPYGAYDMAGNVREWVDDWYAAYPGNTVSEMGFGTTYRVQRGGTWMSDSSGVRSTSRSWSVPAVTYDVGFRCARSQ